MNLMLEWGFDKQGNGFEERNQKGLAALRKLKESIDHLFSGNDDFGRNQADVSLIREQFVLRYDEKLARKTGEETGVADNEEYAFLSIRPEGREAYGLQIEPMERRPDLLQMKLYGSRGKDDSLIKALSKKVPGDQQVSSVRMDLNHGHEKITQTVVSILVSWAKGLKEQRKKDQEKKNQQNATGGLQNPTP
jgi:hypothetical protein